MNDAYICYTRIVRQPSSQKDAGRILRSGSFRVTRSVRSGAWKNSAPLGGADHTSAVSHYQL
ncbi:uncharacterized protein B0H18DRAFT_1050408 [Fomitopsis serialis]|uniref:uncharacterized protein n=1 Tax=Fomitopsis serialis TaxID=139415 RepID=UPI00200729FF|nr:uncharacterized protein B0H18DRAFT_1050408 [Neoantrodia serialis]KAH9913178.1 hypothetical protein B0H18DRAFT_1050408 [Neoantrodia serialis]